jgi:tetratricopeptide (TPR) repeat protein
MPAMESEQQALLENYRAAMQHYRDARYTEARAAHAEVRRLEPNGFCDSVLSGMVCFEQQRFAEALAHCERALSLRPNTAAPYSRDPYPYIYTSLVLLCLGRPEEALAACERGSAALPEAQVLDLQRGELLLRLERIEEAAACYDQVLRRDPTSQEALTYRGFALYALGRLDESLEMHERLLALAPELPEAHLFKGRVLEKQGRLQRALACYEEAIRLDGALAEAWAYKGGVLWQMRSQGPGLLSEAASCYEEAIRLDPGSPLSHNGLGNVLMTQRRYREATSAYARASALQPGVKVFQYNRQQAARAAEGLEPRAVWSATGKGEHSANPLMQEYQGLQLILQLMEDERLEEALEACEQARSMLKTEAFVEALLMMKGTILEAMARYAEAFAVYEELIDSCPGDGHAYYWRARVMIELDPQRDVLVDLEVATDLDPSLQDAWVMRGERLAEAGRYEEALLAFERALALPEGEDTALLYSRKGQVLTLLERHEQALAAYERARDIDAGNQYHWMNVGVGLSQLGRHAEALDAYHAAIQRDPRSPLIPFLLSNTGSELLSLGRDEEAASWFEHAIADALGASDQQILGGGQVQDRFTLAMDHYGLGQALSHLGRDAEALASFEATAAFFPGLPDLAEALARTRRAARRRHSYAAVSAAAGGQKPTEGGPKAVVGASASASAEGQQGQSPRFVDLFIGAMAVTGGILSLLSWGITHFGRQLYSLALPVAILSLLHPLFCWLGWSWQVAKTTGPAPSPLAVADVQERGPRPDGAIWQVRLRRFHQAALFGGLFLLVPTVALAELALANATSRSVSTLVQLTQLGALLLLLHLAAMLAALLALCVLRRWGQRQARGSGANGA